MNNINQLLFIQKNITNYNVNIDEKIKHYKHDIFKVIQDLTYHYLHKKQEDEYSNDIHESFMGFLISCLDFMEMQHIHTKNTSRLETIYENSTLNDTQFINDCKNIKYIDKKHTVIPLIKKKSSHNIYEKETNKTEI